MMKTLKSIKFLLVIAVFIGISNVWAADLTPEVCLNQIRKMDGQTTFEVMKLVDDKGAFSYEFIKGYTSDSAFSLRTLLDPELESKKNPPVVFSEEDLNEFIQVYKDLAYPSGIMYSFHPPSFSYFPRGMKLCVDSTEVDDQICSCVQKNGHEFNSCTVIKNANCHEHLRK